MTESAPDVAEVIVIGAGVIGVAIVAELRRHGIDCLVVESDVPGRAVSEVSFAWVNASSDKSPLSYRKLNVMGLEAHHRLHESGDAPWFHPVGSLELESDSSGGAGSIYADGSDAGEYDDLDGRAPAVPLTPGEFAQHGLSAEITRATAFPREGWVDIGQQIQETLAALPPGRVLAPIAATAIAPPVGEEGTTVTLADGRVLQARHVVIASGNGANDLIDSVRPGLAPIEEAAQSTHVGLSIETFPLENPPTTVLRAPGVSLRPTREGGVVIADHATAASHTLSDPDLLAVPATLIERARSLAPQLGEITVRSVRIGPRVWPRDGRTVCGWLADGVYTVLTHSGVTLAPFLAQCVRRELKGMNVPELTEYRPDRFQKG